MLIRVFRRATDLTANTDQKNKKVDPCFPCLPWLLPGSV
jgi:hypothetical protein